MSEIEKLTKQKDQAYWERNQLVVLLSKIYPSLLSRHSDEDKDWEDDWRWIVCIHTPAGQATWHIHDSEYENFNHLKHELGHWDGHSVEVKYARLKRIKPKKRIELIPMKYNIEVSKEPTLLKLDCHVLYPEEFKDLISKINHFSPHMVDFYAEIDKEQS